MCTLGGKRRTGSVVYLQNREHRNSDEKGRKPGLANKNNNGLDGSCTYSAVKSGVGRLEARPRFVALLRADEMMMVDRDV